MSAPNTVEEPSVTSPDGSIARNFSSELDGAFNLAAPPQVAELVQTVQEKRQTIQSQSEELRALDEKLKATESALQEKTEGPLGSAVGYSGAPAEQHVPEIPVKSGPYRSDVT